MPPRVVVLEIICTDSDVTGNVLFSTVLYSRSVHAPESGVWAGIATPGAAGFGHKPRGGVLVVIEHAGDDRCGHFQNELAQGGGSRDLRGNAVFPKGVGQGPMMQWLVGS